MNGFDWDKLTELRNEWYTLFDQMVELIEANNGCVIVNTPIFDYIKVEQGVRKQMRLHSMRVITGMLTNKHVILEYMDSDNGQLREVLVSRAFEAKAFGDIRYTKDCFKFILKVLQLTYKNENRTMAKTEVFKKGALVSTKKLNGEPLLGVYEHGYDSGDECCVLAADNRKFCVKLKSTKLANEEETKIIQETIIKPRREAEKKRKQAEIAQEESLTEEDLEEMATEEAETTSEE